VLFLSSKTWLCAIKSACFSGPQKTPEIDHRDRLLWIFLFHIWRDWRSAPAIVKPETAIAWHRAGFRFVVSVADDAA
jgi:hypothetical protein